jgi:type III secretion protein D
MNPLVLRVLNGRLAGAEKEVERGGRISVGHQFWQDVTLREPSVRGTAVEIELGQGEQAQVSVLSGGVTLLGSTVEAGGSAILPPYVPLSVGGVAVAWGDPESARWQDATSLAGAVVVPPPPPPTRGDQALAVVGKAREQAAGFVTGPRIALVVGAILLLVGLSSFGPIVDTLGLRPDEVKRVQMALRDANLPDLQATRDETGGVFVTGIVTDEAARARAQDVLRQAHIPGTVDVRTTTDLANAAAEVARLRGLEANGKPTGRGLVELHTIPLQPEARTALIGAIRDDVGGIRRLAIVQDLIPADETPIRTVADATKKVSTVVAGDPAYIKTADGARYFAGAMMPSGHRLVAIKDQTVVLEKNGREIRLSF